MNLPNKLTVIRIALVPLFMFALLFEPFQGRFFAAVLIFALASLTDLLDGKIARETGKETDFGRFADPLADKILVMSAFICFVQLGLISAVVAVIVLVRELTVTSLRLVASADGNVISANMWGKAKTVSQMIAIIFILLTEGIKEAAAVQHIIFFDIAAQVLIWISVILTIISGIIYIYDNKNLIRQI